MCLNTGVGGRSQMVDSTGFELIFRYDKLRHEKQVRERKGEHLERKGRKITYNELRNETVNVNTTEKS